MRRMTIAALAALFGVMVAAAPAAAQDHNFPTPGGAIVDGKVEMCLNSSGHAAPCSAAGALPSAVSPYSFTPLTPMQSGLTIASSTALTVPTGATYAVVCAYGQAVNYTTDGTTTPTTTSSGAGMQLAVGSCVPLSGATVISNFRAIQQSATATLSVSYFK